MRILIADDEEINCDLLASILMPYGTCVFASNGAEAAGLFAESVANNNPFELVMLDIKMPIMDGQSALKAIRRIEKHDPALRHPTVVIIVTSLDSQEEITRAFLEGQCTDYLTKPIEKELLLKKLRQFHWHQEAPFGRPNLYG
ncbi:MAG: response regulator [Magnetococcus sp. DMHC-6]